MTPASGVRDKPRGCLTPRGQANRSAGVLLCVLAAVTLAGCVSGPAIPNIGALASGASDAGGSDAGTALIAHPVGDLDLEAMAQPGSEWLTDGPVRGNGPSTVSLPPVRGHDRMLHIAFLCLDTTGRPVTASYTWPLEGQSPDGLPYSTSGNMQCDPGPDTANAANCQGDGSCSGRAVQTFGMLSPVPVMPRIRVPRGASWLLFAWLAPLSIQPGAGVSADGTGLNRFSGYGLSFTYPRSWYSQAPGQVDPTLATTLEFESTAQLRNACPVTSNSSGAGGGYPCGSAPLAALRPGGVLVDWSVPDQTSPGGVPEVGRPRTIAGYPGWLYSGRAAANGLSVGSPADTLVGTIDGQQSGISCRELKASWVVSVGISTSTSSGYQMLACVRGPDTSQVIREVLAMVNSLQLGRNPGS